VWLVTWKKAAGKTRFGVHAALEEALCFGWIAGAIRTLDDERRLVWMAPRKPRSAWSRAHKECAERLAAEGRLAPAGRASIAAARKDASWTRLDAVEALQAPPDLVRALARSPKARRTFEAFPRSTRRRLLEWIEGAKRPETRAKRIEETARMARLGVPVNLWTR
jgi:uncharacterized protein YdeI (YjbR/CyaY-like superfamily)